MPEDRKSQRGPKPSLQSGKVISLRGHQAAESALDDLFLIDRSSPEYDALTAKAVALDAPFLAAIVRRLDSSQPRDLSLLGELLAHFPVRAQAIQALMRAAADRRASDTRRLAAILLLSAYWPHLASAHDFILDLHDPGAALASALTAALEVAARDPAMAYEYRDYVGVLLAQPVDTLYAALRTLTRMKEDAAVEALCSLALCPHLDLMSGAIEALSARSSAPALKALAMLEPNLPPEPAHAVSRLLSKAKLSGNVDMSLLLGPRGHPDSRCRALASAIDGSGSRVLWLHVPLTEEGFMETVGLLMNDTEGLVGVISRSGRDALPFPGAAPVGTMHPPLDVNVPQSQVVTEHCLEVPFGYGLRLLRDAVAQTWAAQGQLPLDYLLLFPAVWRFGGATEEYADGAAESPHPDGSPSAEGESDLLSTPNFEGWYLQSEGTLAVAEYLAGLSGGRMLELGDTEWHVLVPSVIRLAHDEFTPEVCAFYSRRLRLMSEWLGLAGRHHEAALAASAARTMLQSPPEANLFVLRLVQKGILMHLNGGR